eukprot:2150319-Rhodomonas_salina.4
MWKSVSSGRSCPLERKGRHAALVGRRGRLGGCEGTSPGPGRPARGDGGEKSAGCLRACCFMFDTQLASRSNCALAVRCPILTWRIVLRRGYAMSGTDLADGAARLLRELSALEEEVEKNAEKVVSGVDIGSVASGQVRTALGVKGHEVKSHADFRAREESERMRKVAYPRCTAHLQIVECDAWY